MQKKKQLKENNKEKPGTAVVVVTIVVVVVFITAVVVSGIVVILVVSIKFVVVSWFVVMFVVSIKFVVVSEIVLIDVDCAVIWSDFSYPVALGTPSTLHRIIYLIIDTLKPSCAAVKFPWSYVIKKNSRISVTLTTTPLAPVALIWIIKFK